MPALSRSILLATLCLLPAASVLAKPIKFTDVSGREVTVDAPAKRVVLGFHFEEFTAIAGAKAWQNVVGISKTGWAPTAAAKPRY